MKWLAPIAVLGIVAATLTTQIGIASAESNMGVRVMPLGDSITDGAYVPGGYRLGLWQDFANAGYKVDFVGSQFNGPPVLGDHDHEGHPSWRIDQIDANIVNWLTTSQPHSVLMQIGTNDIVQNYNLSTAPDRLSALIDHITAMVPSAEVFVAQITPLANSSQEAAAVSFNAAITGIVQSKANAGKHVHLVDMHSAITTADLVDGVHPNAAGYDKMTAVWYSALQSVSGSIGTSGHGFSITGVGSGRCVDDPAWSQTNGTQMALWDCYNNSGNQTWTYTSGKQITLFGTKCLQEAGAGWGSAVQISDCTSGNTAQQWTFNSNATLTNVASGLCMDANGGGTANSTLLIMWGCSTNGATNQLWTRR